MERIEISELVKNMHTTKSEMLSMNKSSYEEQNNILIVNVTSTADETFISEVCMNKSEEINVAIVTIENTNENALFHATALVEILRSKDMCVICISKERDEPDENGNQAEPPIEVELKELKDKIDMLIIMQCKHDYQDVIDFLFVSDQTYQGTNSCSISDFLYNRFKNIGFAYYNSIYAGEEWNSRTLINLAMFDSMFVCPIYKAQGVLLQIEAGEEFRLSEENDLNDEGIVIGELEEHLQANCKLNSWVEICDELEPYAIKMDFLFFDFDENVFVFDEKNSWQYPKAENIFLEKRIERLIQTPFYVKQKRMKYRKYKRERKREYEN